MCQMKDIRIDRFTVYLSVFSQSFLVKIVIIGMECHQELRTRTYACLSSHTHTPFRQFIILVDLHIIRCVFDLQGVSQVRLSVHNKKCSVLFSGLSMFLSDYMCVVCLCVYDCLIYQQFDVLLVLFSTCRQMLLTISKQTFHMYLYIYK